MRPIKEQLINVPMRKGVAIGNLGLQLGDFLVGRGMTQVVPMRRPGLGT